MFGSIPRFLWDTTKTLVLALLIVIPLRLWVAQPFFVRGSSMEPTFSDGDYLIIDELSYRFHTPQRGDVIVFHYPRDPSQFFIKRIIGLPGDTVISDSGHVSVQDRSGKRVALDETYIRAFTESFRLEVTDNNYVVLGDNRPASSDSRRWGLLPRDLIVGRVFITVWPPTDFSLFSAPAYGR